VSDHLSPAPSRISLQARRPGVQAAVAAVSGAAVTAALLVAPGLVTPAQAANGPAPGAPGTEADWVPGDKTGFGTARGTASKVWYTLSRGKLSDVYYPRIDTPSIRDSQFVVTDGSSFTDREDTDARSRVTLLDRRSLTYRLTSTARSGDWRITKTFVTDPRRSTVLERVRFESLTGKALKLYLLHDPALNMTGDDDTGRSSASGVLVASDAEVASAVVTRPAMTRTSSGYLGQSDGWTDLRDDHSMDWTYQAPAAGNVVQTGRVPVNGLRGKRAFTLSLGFGTSENAAVSNARASLGAGFAAKRRAYAVGWHTYLRDTVRDAPDSVGRFTTEWNMSAMVLAASEDKTYRGGFVAAPGKPWAWANDLQNLPVYHAVWSRDLYQIMTGLLAVGDRAAATRTLDYLWAHQQRPDGSFPQNSRLDGEKVFGDLQMDEVAFPIVMAWQLGRRGSSDWAHVKLSADFIVANGPSTPQERWENIGGYSPATIGAEIAGLVLAADIARRNGDTTSEAKYLQTADTWAQQVQSWTATSTGPYDPKPYYLRISKNGTPDAGTVVQISDGGPLIDERYVVDPSFLDLVRLGVKKASDPVIRNSLAVVDEQLGYRTDNGPFWHRASFDGYGEQRDGSQWEPSDPGSGKTLGRGWPLLSGERGEYALQAGNDGFATRLLRTMGRSAHDRSHFMPEQVWDDQPPSGSAERFEPGEPTMSAMPLAWTHAQFARLARSLDLGRNIETPELVACRYQTEAC
jgi:glucoamylase